MTGPKGNSAIYFRKDPHHWGGEEAKLTVSRGISHLSVLFYRPTQN